MSDIASPRFHDHNEEADQIAPPVLKTGKPIHLVRWTITPTGWQPTSFTAIYLSHSKTDWSVVLQGQRLTLPRASWAAYLP